MTDVLRVWTFMDRCTVEARRAIWHARNAVFEVGGTSVGLEHVVLGLMAPDVRASSLFTALPHPGEDLRRELIGLLAGSGNTTAQEVPFSNAVVAVIGGALAEADKQAQDRIQSGHILLAILNAPETPVARLLQTRGLAYEFVRAQLAGSTPEADGA
jgi:ATP-dependent Clp protease ATP-binding subunit ClpA